MECFGKKSPGELLCLNRTRRDQLAGFKTKRRRSQAKYQSTSWELAVVEVWVRETSVVREDALLLLAIISVCGARRGSCGACSFLGRAPTPISSLATEPVV